MRRSLLSVCSNIEGVLLWASLDSVDKLPLFTYTVPTHLRRRQVAYCFSLPDIVITVYSSS
jgi:hypothetical protein